MRSDAKQIIDEFGALSDTAKREVLTELIRMSQKIDYPKVSDEEFLGAANEIFLEYDRREAE